MHHKSLSCKINGAFSLLSYAVGSENLILNPPIIPKLIFFFILIALLLDIVLILCGEIMPQSLDHRS